MAANDEMLVRSVALLGTGHEGVRKLKQYAAMHAVARVMLVARTLSFRSCRRDFVEQLIAISGWLCSQSAERIEVVAESLGFQASLNALETSAEIVGPTEQLNAALSMFPILFLRYLSEIDGNRVWHAGHALSARLCPIGMTQKVAVPIEISLTNCARGVLFENGNQLAEYSIENNEIRLSLGVNRGLEIQRLELLSFDIQKLEVPQAEALVGSVRLDASEVGSVSTPEARRAILRGLSFLSDVWPEATIDVLAFVRGIVAIDVTGERVFSASAPSLPGVVLLTIRPNEPAHLIAESLVHEVSHIKLDLMWSNQPLILNDVEARFRHPWRQDLRPLRGVYLGVHAFVAVIEFMRRAQLLAPDLKLLLPQREQELRSAALLLRDEATFTEVGAGIYHALMELALKWDSNGEWFANAS